MKIYHVQLASNRTYNYLGYDTYSEFVVIANSESEARFTNPSNGAEIDPKQKWVASWVDPEDCQTLVAEQIGVCTNPNEQKRVVCAIFHAG